MKTVTKKTSIKRNLETFEALRGAERGSKEFNYYQGLVLRGLCFVPYMVNGRLHFAPSRFIGYVGVSMEKHRDADKHGTLTTNAISKVLQVPLVRDSGIEAEYKRFLDDIVGYSEAPPRYNRKFWLTDDAVDFVAPEPDENAQQVCGLTETEKAAVIQARIGQATFRKALIRKWRTCAVTGCSLISLLRASHIKPWCDSTDVQRLDPDNGLLLNPNLDLLFDQGFISFDGNGDLILSREFAKSEQDLLLPQKIKRLCLNPAQLSYLEYHRCHVFLGSGA